MPWFVDITLMNPKTGDPVRKRLDLKLDVSSDTPESWATLAAMAFEKALPEMLREAAAKDGERADE